MTNSITNRQLATLLIMTLTCYSVVVISKEVTQIAGTGAWFTVLLTSLVFGLAVAVIAYLNNMFHGKMLFEYAQQLVTKPGAYLLAIFYILYYILILVFLITGFSKLLNHDFIPKTPLWAIPLVGIPVFCIIAYKGITNVARLSEIILFIYLITAVTVHILMLTQGEIGRILPLFNPAEMGNYLRAFQYSIFPFLGIEVLLSIPFTKKNGVKAVKTAFFSMIFVGLFYILIIQSSIMKLGIHDIITYKDPLIAAIRDTSPPALEFFARLDILYLTIGFAGIFTGLSIVITAATEFVCRVFPHVSRVIVVSIIGAVVYITFLFVKSISGYDEFVTRIGTYLGLTASILIPIILLFIAKIKIRGMK